MVGRLGGRGWGRRAKRVRVRLEKHLRREVPLLVVAAVTKDVVGGEHRRGSVVVEAVAVVVVGSRLEGHVGEHRAHLLGWQ